MAEAKREDAAPGGSRAAAEGQSKRRFRKRGATVTRADARSNSQRDALAFLDRLFGRPSKGGGDE